MYVIPSYSANLYNRINQNNNRNVSRPVYSNLSPLSKDTVSFSGGKKDIRNDGDDGIHGVNKTTAIVVHQDAERAYLYLSQKLNNILGDMVRPESGKGSQSKPIQTIRSRIKNVDSIIEKSMTRKLDNAKEVKEGITDIVGARIVMADSSRQAVDAVINRFTKAVQNNELKIIEIENYRPEPEVDDDGNILKSYDYASAKALKELKLACDDKMGTSIRKVDEDVPSGYMAIHMLVQLPNGFTGEIQIIGNEVEKLKDIEDICFKIKNGKNPKGVSPKIKKMLAPLKDKDDVILRKEHNIYTREAYLYQREKEINKSSKNKGSDNFLSIPNYLPESLDFNKLYKEING